MGSQIEQVLIEAEARYLQADGIDQLKHFVKGWSQRLSIYQTLREQEPQILLTAMGHLQSEKLGLTPQVLSLCQQDLALTLRQAAMAMLLQDEDLLKQGLLEWLEEQVRLYNLQQVYETAFRSLQTALKTCLSPAQLEFIKPFVTQAQVTLLF
jgi:hypothetical protein